MTDPGPHYEDLARRFASWASREDGIRAAVVIGSRARTDHPADAWADLDLVVIARDPEPYLARTDWVAKIGRPILSFIEPTGDGRSREQRVLFECGLDVDFAFFPVAVIEGMLAMGIPADAADAFRRGARILVDKDGLARRVLTAVAKLPPSSPSPPTEEQFLEAVHDFWYHAVWTAKHLRRGELWWAKSGCDVHMKGLLRRMLEWHARAMNGPGHDTWMRGRFLEEWADPRAVTALREAFARYDADDLWHALAATMDLFRWLAEETAAKLNYDYPSQGDAAATELVGALRDGA
jgi:aminoglycoside 6-adenylyltransferase